MSYISMVGLTKALDQLLTLSESRLEEHSRGLSTMLIEGVRAIGWMPFRAMEDSSASPHIVALSHSELGVERIMDVLQHNQPYYLWNSQRSHQNFPRALQQ